MCTPSIFKEKRLNMFFCYKQLYVYFSVLFLCSLFAVCSSFEEGVSSPELKRSRVETSSSDKRGPFGEEFAIATTDTAFKHMLSLSVNDDKTVMQSFLNCFVPEFRTDPVADILEEWPTSIPALKKRGQKQTFMDLHVATRSGVHYIIEMQAQRHEQFDERCLFYACSTYAKQLSARELEQTHWYRLLRPTIAIQVLDFDTNRARGIIGIRGRDDRELIDTLVERAKQNPLPMGEYIKDYAMTCQRSGQIIHDLRMIQVELPRSPAAFPPRSTFTETDWWLSLLRYSEKYKHKTLRELEEQGIIMPSTIQAAFRRLDYGEWDAELRGEYKEDISDRENFKTTLLVEHEEGRARGKAERDREIAIKWIKKGKLDTDILEDLEISAEVLAALRAELLTWQEEDF
jgi:hypothetical protein